MRNVCAWRCFATELCLEQISFFLLQLPGSLGFRMFEHALNRGVR